MKKILSILIILTSSLVSMFSVISCEGTIPATVTPTKTDAFKEGEVLDARITLSLGSSLAQGVSLRKIIAVAGTLKEPGEDFLHYRYKAGDRCIIVFGDVNNNTEQDLYFWAGAAAIDSEGEPVGQTILPSWETGYQEYFLPQKTTISFLINIGWADDIAYIELGAMSNTESGHPYWYNQ